MARKALERVSVETIERALDIHQDQKGSIASWHRCKDDGSQVGDNDPTFANHPFWAVETRHYEWFTFNMREANALCVGLARGFTAGSELEPDAYRDSYHNRVTNEAAR